MFTQEELAFVYQVLDQVRVSGLKQKAMVVQIMAKIEAGRPDPLVEEKKTRDNKGKD